MSVEWVHGQWLPVFGDLTIQGTMALAAGLGIARFAASVSAAKRHLILSASLAAVVLLTAISPFVSDASSRSRIAYSSAAPSHSAADRYPASHSIGSITAAIVERSRPLQSDGYNRGTIDLGRPQHFKAVSPKMALLLFIIWTAGATALLTRFVLGFSKLNALMRRCRQTTHETVCEIADELKERAGLRRPLMLMEAPDDLISAPMTWGMRQVYLLLPESAAEWPQARLWAAMAHEVAHGRRQDWLTQTVTMLACCVYWYNPLIWMLAKGLRLEAERACDDAVLAQGMSGAEYAHHLLDVARIAQARYVLPNVMSMARPSQVTIRVRSLLDPRHSRVGATRPAVIVTLLAVIALSACAIYVRPFARNESKPGSGYGSSNPASRMTPDQIAGSGYRPPAGYDRPFQAAVAKMDQTALLAGATEVQGPGIVVTLRDSSTTSPLAPVYVREQSIVHDTDILQVVNELRAAGAEAVSVNDQRLVATSPIRCIGPAIHVNGASLAPPYLVRAIGDPEALQEALKFSHGIYETLQNAGSGMIDISKSSQVVIPAYQGGAATHYAQPVAVAAAIRH